MQGQWIDLKERIPTKEDADEWGCVLVWDRYNGVKVCGWNNTFGLAREPVTHWMTPPERPMVEGQAS